MKTFFLATACVAALLISAPVASAATNTGFSVGLLGAHNSVAAVEKGVYTYTGSAPQSWSTKQGATGFAGGIELNYAHAFVTAGPGAFVGLISADYQFAGGASKSVTDSFGDTTKVALDSVFQGFLGVGYDIPLFDGAVSVMPSYSVGGAAGHASMQYVYPGPDTSTNGTAVLGFMQRARLDVAFGNRWSTSVGYAFGHLGQARNHYMTAGYEDHYQRYARVEQFQFTLDYHL